MARHIITLESVVPFTVETLDEIEMIVRRILDAGLYVVLHKEKPYVIQSSRDIYKGGYVEIILEGQPFEQEYVTDFDAFNRWLSKRLPKPTLTR